MVKMTHTEEGKIMLYLSKYQNPERTKRDITSVLKEYRGLQYAYERFVFNDGSCQSLINLQGTIPVNYKGHIYNIPMCIWLMDTHPNNAPMCFVKPTADMTIRVGMYVDHNGKIYLPYLHDWAPHSSDLLSLIQIMILTFGDTPPVFAKRNPNTQITTTAATTTITTTTTTTTATTPYPSQPAFMPVPGGPSNSIDRSFPPCPLSPQYTSVNTPYPFYPPASGSGFSGGYPGYPPMGGMTPNYPPQGFSDSFPYPPIMPPSPPMSSMNKGNSDTITEEHIRASLLSAVGDKLRRRLCEQISQLHAELETLRRTCQELRNGSSRLGELFDKLQKEKQGLEKNINILQDKESELEKEIEKLSDNQSIDVDEAVTTITPLYKQMLTTFAEEAATEDAIYYLGEGLREGSINLDVFLKNVRQLSRRQFMLRALMLRCRQKAEMAG